MGELVWKSGLVLVGWAGVDYLLVWQKNESDLKMSRQDMKDEAKQTEGNPANKGRIRRLQRSLRRRQMLRDTEKASVVITNPTHYAVALRYEMEMAAPIVVAKGRDFLAQEIKEVARWHGIPILENRPLAQALYKTVEVGQPIPGALYAAVAEILAFVFRAQARARQQAKEGQAR
jgi:flagellar biosynthetic protein FlhB